MSSLLTSWMTSSKEDKTAPLKMMVGLFISISQKHAPYDMAVGNLSYF